MKKIELKDITRELAFVPGYTGYLPGYHLVQGVSSGQHSQNHLTRVWDAGGKNKEQTLMPPIYYTDADRQKAIANEQRQKDLLRQHAFMQGGMPKFTDHVDPKYTGFFPNQHYRFGQRNSVRTREGAVEMLEKRHQERAQSPDTLQGKPVGFPAGLEERKAASILNPTLEPDYGAKLNKITFRKDVGDYLTREVDKALTKPYSLPPDHRLKRFMQGYTAWLPFTKEFVGMSRADMSKLCLKEMERVMFETDKFRATPGVTERPKSTRKPAVAADQIVFGVPGYTGYKEGTKYRFGYTHGDEMREVVKNRHPCLPPKDFKKMTSALPPRASVQSF